jgi:manganese transport protein
MDPGNWATDLAGGARYGYTLLSVILISNLMAILLPRAKLGIVTGATSQACLIITCPRRLCSGCL